jgi:predicted phosphohydrolase
MEQGDPLGQGVPGLELWARAKVERDAERQAAYILRLRTFLAGMDRLPQDLKGYLRTATDAEVLADLVRPITWETGAGPLEAVLQEIKGRLVTFGHAKGVAARDAEKVVGALHLEAWTVATRDKDRALDRAGFIRVFDDQTQTSSLVRQRAAIRNRACASAYSCW